MGEVVMMPPAGLDIHHTGGKGHLGHHSEYLAQTQAQPGSMSPPGSSSAASPETRPVTGSPVSSMGDPFGSSSSLFAAFQPGADPFTHRDGNVSQEGLSAGGGFDQVKGLTMDSGLLAFDFKQMGRDLSDLQGEDPLPTQGPPSLQKAASYHSVGGNPTSPHTHQQAQGSPKSAIAKPGRGGDPLGPSMSFGPDHGVGFSGAMGKSPGFARHRAFSGFGGADVMPHDHAGHHHSSQPGGPYAAAAGVNGLAPPHSGFGGEGIGTGGYGGHPHSHTPHAHHHTARQGQAAGASVPSTYFYPHPGSGGPQGYGHNALGIPVSSDPAGGIADPSKGGAYIHAPGHVPGSVDGHDASAVYAAHAAAAGICGAPVALQQPRFYFPGYEGGPLLTLPHQGAGTVMAQAPTHHLVATAAGMSMVPLNQLVTLPNGQVFQVMRAVSPVDGQCHPLAYPAMPFFLHPASAHAGKSGYGSSGSDSRDGSPSRHSKDDDHYGRRRDRDRDGKDKRHGSKKRVERDPEVLAALSSAMHDDCPSLEEILKASSVHSLSQDQVGCRFLQLKLDEGGAESATLIFSQAKPYLAEMMTDPFGNYLFQKLIEKVTDQERTSVLSLVRDRLVEAALNLHGTRSVQRLVEVCKSQEQIEMMVLALRNDVVRLCVDANGNHVIQRALQHLGPDDRGFIFDAISQHCVEVSTHRHGCCVMQRCLDAATSPQKRILVSEIGRHCLQLMQDPYGNYVVQYVLDRCTGEEIRAVTTCSLGRVASLSVQKYSSNVIEKCLERASEDVQAQLIEEMCSPGNIKHLMQDQYGNYVVQRALSVATHSKGLALVEAIRPHLHSMRNTAGGRRIVAKIAKRFPSVDLGSDLIAPR